MLTFHSTLPITATKIRCLESHIIVHFEVYSKIFDSSLFCTIHYFYIIITVTWNYAPNGHHYPSANIFFFAGRWFIPIWTQDCLHDKSLISTRFSVCCIASLSISNYLSDKDAVLSNSSTDFLFLAFNGSLWAQQTSYCISNQLHAAGRSVFAVSFLQIYSFLHGRINVINEGI